MFISRIVIRNYRNFRHFDVNLQPGATCVIGENNTGKTNFLRAIRLAVDASYSSQYRKLLEHDVHCGEDLTVANQVLVSIEFTGYKDSVNELALLGTCEVEDDKARIHYRFRPVRAVRDKIEASEHDGTNLSISEDYHFEITGGGGNDPASVEWNEELGASLRFGHLQAFQVEYLPALRDVQHILRQAYDSPLGRILNASDIGDDEKNALVDVLREANSEIEKQPTIKSAGDAIKKAFSSSSGVAHQIDLRLGMADPSFISIARSLKVLLTDDSISDFEPGRNGLGLNNILYISMLLEYFERRIDSSNAAGQLLLIEEPEAHLHPQLQRVLYTTLAEKHFQSILTTHSTHVSSHAPIESFITLTNDGSGATSGHVPRESEKITQDDADDLNRYLDATRSTLLYARKVIFVEGPAELFLIPVLIKKVMDIDLDSYGISVVPIYGTHFEVYTKLFGDDGLRKKCAVICDGDLEADTLVDVDEDECLEDHSFKAIENDYVQVFQCPVTFERAITLPETLPMMIEAIRECNYPRILRDIEQGHDALRRGGIPEDDQQQILLELREKVLNSAIRCGKARFAQIASKYANLVDDLPEYIEEAVNWLIEE